MLHFFFNLKLEFGVCLNKIECFIWALLGEGSNSIYLSQLYSSIMLVCFSRLGEMGVTTPHLVIVCVCVCVCVCVWRGVHVC